LHVYSYAVHVYTYTYISVYIQEMHIYISLDTNKDLSQDRPVLSSGRTPHE